MNVLLDMLLPQRCAGCGSPGAACCARCAIRADTPLRVHRRLLRALPAYALTEYDGAARGIVLAYKERGRGQLAASFGAALATVLTGALPGVRAPPDGVCWLVPAPSKASTSRARGGPHMVRVARRCAASVAAVGHPAAVAPALRLTGGVCDSVGLDAAARAANLAGRVRAVPRGLPPPGTAVVLLDDVLTTGATAAACRAALAAHGVSVRCVLTLTAAIAPGRAR